MTHETSEYEFARKILKREAKNPSGYTKNRQLAVMARIQKQCGDKGIKELAKEYKKELKIT